MSSKRPDASSSSHDIEIGGPSETDSLLGRGRTRVTRFFHGFVDFAFQGSILQIAFGLILAAAFTDLVKSFVGAILMPPISVILPINKNIEEKFAVLRPGPKYNASSPAGGYNTMLQAQADGAVVMAYGSLSTRWCRLSWSAFRSTGWRTYIRLFLMIPLSSILKSARIV
ncbi:hypothetical protein V8C34DRAFT_300984 [Trichoderma compactum]